MRVFFVVLARDASAVDRKIKELNGLGFPYVIVCGERVDQRNVVYREPRGKFDALNCGFGYVPAETDVVVFNDVDTEIHDFDCALRLLRDDTVSFVFVKVRVASGPQQVFYSFLDSVRRRIPIAASGELMLMRSEFFHKI